MQTYAQIVPSQADAAHAGGSLDTQDPLYLRTWRKAMDRRIARAQAQVTAAARAGEPESAPHVRQMLAELERLENLRMAH